MKRIVIVLLALVLLCGCSTSKQASEQIVETMQPTYDKQVLEGSVWVQTDYSKYTPSKPIEAKYTRLSEEFIPALQPSEDYGMIYPFVGSYSNSGYTVTTRYGIVDASGRVVADAVYDNIEPICQSGGLSAQAAQVKPMWRLGKRELINDYPEMRYALATWDGSFVTEHIYWAVTAYDEYVLAYTFGSDEAKPVIHVYDTQGNLCLNTEELPFFDRLSDNSYIDYGEGLFTVQLNEPSGYYIADWEGNLLHGPFGWADAYVDGYAVVEKRNGYYAYLDVNGNYLEDMEFAYADTFSDGYAVASNDTGTKFLLSAKSGLIADIDAASAYWNGSYFSVWKQTDTGSEHRAYSTEGELLYEWADSEYCEFIGTGELVHYYEEGKAVNLETGEEFQFGNMYEYSISTFDYMYSFEEVPYYYVYYFEPSKRTVLMDADFREVLTTTGYIDIWEDIFTAKRYIMVDDGRIQLYDMNAEPIVLLQYDNCQVYNDMALCYDDIASYYYDLEGNLLFCYPYSSIADD